MATVNDNVIQGILSGTDQFKDIFDDFSGLTDERLQQLGTNKEQIQAAIAKSKQKGFAEKAGAIGLPLLNAIAFIADATSGDKKRRRRATAKAARNREAFKETIGGFQTDRDIQLERNLKELGLLDKFDAQKFGLKSGVAARKNKIAEFALKAGISASELTGRKEAATAKAGQVKGPTQKDLDNQFTIDIEEHVYDRGGKATPAQKRRYFRLHGTELIDDPNEADDIQRAKDYEKFKDTPDYDEIIEATVGLPAEERRIRIDEVFEDFRINLPGRRRFKESADKAKLIFEEQGKFGRQFAQNFLPQGQPGVLGDDLFSAAQMSPGRRTALSGRPSVIDAVGKFQQTGDVSDLLQLGQFGGTLSGEQNIDPIIQSILGSRTSPFKTGQAR